MNKFALLALSMIFTASAFTAQAVEFRTSLTAQDTSGEIVFASVDAGATLNELRTNKLELNTSIPSVIAFPGSGFFGGGVKASATNKVGAVILLHGSGGMGKPLKMWADRLNAQGVATLMVDAFSGRGITSTMEDQSQLNRLSGGIDALLALKLLATHPFIDSKRIAVMGFSRGATSSQIAAFQSIRDGVLGKDSDLKFVAHIQFYGGCAVVGKTTGAPILTMVGELDQSVTATRCRYTEALLKQSGANVTLVTYPGTYHAFDQGNKVVFHPKVSPLPNCTPMIDYDTDLVYIPEGRNPMQAVPVSAIKEAPLCQRGPMGQYTGGNSAADQDSKSRVEGFIKTYLQK